MRPFEMIGRVNDCVLLWYAIDPERAAALVPQGLELITARGAAFFNIVVCHVDRMRPRFLPRALGVTFWYVAYRLQVRATLSDGSSIEGLYFLRSEADRPLLVACGNMLTDFRFHASRVPSLVVRPNAWDSLAMDSPFVSLEERDRVLRYATFGLSVSKSEPFVRVTEVFRDEALWKEETVEVEVADWSYPRSLGLEDSRLVRATRIAPIDYRWRIGRTERMGA